MGRSRFSAKHNTRKRTQTTREVLNEVINSIEKYERRKSKVSTIKKGPRLLFLEKYKVTGDVEEAKKELQEHGYKGFNDNIVQNWIEEDRG